MPKASGLFKFEDVSNERGGRYVVISRKQTGTAERVRYNTTAGAALASGAQVRMHGANGGIRFGNYEEPESGIIDVEWMDAPGKRAISQLADGEMATIRAYTKGTKPGEEVSITVEETASDGAVTTHTFSGPVGAGGVALLKEVCGLKNDHHHGQASTL